MKPQIPALVLLVGAVLVGTMLATHPSRASDHDDGVTDVKTNNVNLTDLYVFREKTQNNSAADDALIFIMNCNPRSVPNVEYFFNARARYEFHVGRVGEAGKNDDAPTGVSNFAMRFEFSEPDTNKVQKISFIPVNAGVAGAAITTNTNATNIATTAMSGSGNPVKNEFQVNGQTVAVFAGLREDPFFFDVNQFFKVRAGAAARLGNPALPQPTFKPVGSDFTEGFNVLSIVVRAPRALFQESSGTKSTTFDVWETVSLRK